MADQFEVAVLGLGSIGLGVIGSAIAAGPWLMPLAARVALPPLSVERATSHCRAPGEFAAQESHHAGEPVDPYAGVEPA